MVQKGIVLAVLTVIVIVLCIVATEAPLVSLKQGENSTTYTAWNTYSEVDFFAHNWEYFCPKLKCSSQILTNIMSSSISWGVFFIFIAIVFRKNNFDFYFRNLPWISLHYF